MASLKVALWLARSGRCSRREAERWIEAGRVTLHGKRVENKALRLDDYAGLAVDGDEIDAMPAVDFWLFHKPRQTITSRSDEKGRRTVFDCLPEDKRNLIAVGRLDWDTEGLLLLTNHGELARFLMLPANRIKRHYEVLLDKPMSEAHRLQLSKGMSWEGVRYRGWQIKDGANGWMKVTLTEGKNREIRRLCDALGYRLRRLCRVGYGPFSLDGLFVGGFRRATQAERVQFSNLYNEEEKVLQGRFL